MKRLAPLVVCAAALAFAPAAPARVVELGTTTTPAKSRCPENPCEVVGRVSGYQGRSDAVRNPFQVPSDGRIVAFTITLARLEQNQMSYFTNLYGGTPAARLTILRRGKRRRSRLDHRVMAQSRLYRLHRYFGSSPTFALSEPLRVRRGNIVALTVPTWAPAFARDLAKTNWWRSSRRKGDCDNVTQRGAQQMLGNVGRYGCTYHTARLLYTATYVPDPQPTDAPQQPQRRPGRR
jgi:hypothetical protein